MIKFILKDGAKLPRRGSVNAAGLDICTNKMFTLHAGERALIETGVYLADCPREIYLRLAPRSKLAFKLGIDVKAGVIDSDYRSEIRVLLKNDSDNIISFKQGDAIAQLIPESIHSYSAIEVKEATVTDRGSAGINDNDLRL